MNMRCRPPPFLQVPAAAAQPAKEQCGDFAEDCFRCRRKFRQSSATRAAPNAAAQLTFQGPEGSGGKPGRLSSQVQHLARNSIGESQPRHLRGRLLRRDSTASRSCLETERKSQPLGKKKRIRPLAFSLEPLSHGEEG